MSVNRWSICPRCKANADAHQREAEQSVARAYGLVSRTEYERLVKEVCTDIRYQETLREDWEVGTYTDGTFEVDYHCLCEHCGFTHSFKHSERLEVNSEGPKP